MGLKLNILGVVGGLASLYLFPLGCNKLVNDNEFMSDHYCMVSKIDGAFGFTQLTKSDIIDKDEIFQYRFFGPTKVMADGGIWGEKDGLVDRIHIISERIIKREKDYERFREEFDNADKILLETKIRFAEYFR